MTDQNSNATTPSLVAVIKQKTLEYMLVAIVLGGLTYAVVSSFRSEFHLKNLADNFETKTQELSAIQLENRKLLLRIAQESNIDFSDIEHSIAVGIKTETPPIYVTYADVETEQVKQELDTIKKKLSVSSQATDRLNKEVEEQYEQYTYLVSAFFKATMENQHVILKKDMIEDQIHAYAQLVAMYDSAVSTINHLGKTIKNISNTASSGDSVLKEINGKIRSVIEVLKKESGLVEIEQQQFKLHEPNALYPDRLLVPSVKLTHDYPKADFENQVDVQMKDQQIAVKSSHVLEIMRATLELHDARNVQLEALRSNVDAENKRLEALIIELNERTMEIDKSMVSLRHNLETITEKLEISKNEYFSKYKSFRKSAVEHNADLGSYGAAFSENLKLLQEYLDVVAVLASRAQR